MGYESKVYIVQKHNHYMHEMRNSKCMFFGEVVASFDMCKFPFPEFTQAFDKPTDCYIFFDGDGDNEVLEDKYGVPLTEASVDMVINCLENLNDKTDSYRRTLPLLAMLKAFKENESEWQNIVILHYGH